MPNNKLLIAAVTMTSLILAACGGGGSSSGSSASPSIRYPSSGSSSSGSHSGSSSSSSSSSGSTSGTSSSSNSSSVPQDSYGATIAGKYFLGVGDVYTTTQVQLALLNKPDGSAASPLVSLHYSGNLENGGGGRSYAQANKALPEKIGAYGKFSGFFSWIAATSDVSHNRNATSYIQAAHQQYQNRIASNNDRNQGNYLKLFAKDVFGDNSYLYKHNASINDISVRGLAPIYTNGVLLSLSSPSSAESYFDAVKSDQFRKACYSDGTLQTTYSCTLIGRNVNVTVVDSGFTNQATANINDRSTRSPTKADPFSSFRADSRHFKPEAIKQNYSFIDLQPDDPTIANQNSDNQTHGFIVSTIIAGNRSAGGIAPGVNFSYGIFKADTFEQTQSPIYNLAKKAINGQLRNPQGVFVPDIVNNSWGGASEQSLEPRYQQLFAQALADKLPILASDKQSSFVRDVRASLIGFSYFQGLQEMAPLFVWAAGNDKSLERKINYYQGKTDQKQARLTYNHDPLTYFMRDPGIAEINLYVTGASADNENHDLQTFMTKMEDDIRRHPQDRERLLASYRWFKYSLADLYEKLPQSTSDYSSWRDFLAGLLNKRQQPIFSNFSFVHNPDSFTCGELKYDCVAANFLYFIPYYREGFFGDTLLTQVVQGTSFSAPIVTATAALVKEQFPWMTAKNLKTTLTTTATDVGEPGVDEVFGWGIVNAAAAVRGPMSFLSGDFVADLRLRNRSVPQKKLYSALEFKASAEQNPNSVTARYYFQNSINGDAGLQLYGVNTTQLWLLGNNTYSGDTLVDSGELVVTPLSTVLDASKLTQAQRESRFYQSVIYNNWEHAGDAEFLRQNRMAGLYNSNVKVGPNGHLRVIDANVKSVTAAGVVSLKNALIQGDLKLINRSDNDAQSLERTRQIGFGEPTVNIELTEQQYVTELDLYSYLTEGYERSDKNYLAYDPAARNGYQEKVFGEDGYALLPRSPGFSTATINQPGSKAGFYGVLRPALRIGGTWKYNDQFQYRLILPRSRYGGSTWLVARWNQLEGISPEQLIAKGWDYNSNWRHARDSSLYYFTVLKQPLESNTLVVHTGFNHARDVSRSLATAAQTSVYGESLLSDTNYEAAHAGTKLLYSILEDNDKLYASIDSKNKTALELASTQPVALAANMLVNADDLSKLAYRSAATAYASTQTTLSQQTRLAARDLFATAADLEANQAHAGLEPNLVQGLTSQAYLKHAQQRSSWEYDKGVLFGKWNHSTTTAGYLANLALADFNLKLGAGLSYTTGDWSEQFKAEQVNNQNNALNPHNGASVNSSTTDKQVADVQTSALSALVNLGASYKGGFANLGLGYSSQGLEASRAVLAKDDLKGSLKRKQYLVDATVGYKLALPSASLTASAGVTSVTTTTAAFKETAVSQDVAVQAFAGDFKDSSKTLWFVHADVKAKVNFDLVSLVTGAANASAGTGATNHSGLDLGASFEYALSGAKQTLTNGNLETGAVFDPKLVQVYSLGYTQSFGLVDLRLGAQYEHNENWHNLEANAKLAVNF